MKKCTSRFSFLVVSCFVILSASAFADDPNTTVDLEQARRLADINKALTEARAIPHFENGKPAGYRKVPADTGGDYEKLELRNGDVMTARDLNYVPSAETVQAPTQGNEQ